MPFSEVYAVDFADGKLQPHINLLNWPDMSRFPLADNQDVQQVADPQGLTLKISRTNPASAGVFNSVIVAPPSGFKSGVRIMTRLIFDLPFASGIPNPSDGHTTFPEAWAVALDFGQDNTLTEDEVAHMTCQFFRRGNLNGVRLNTPSGLQKDQAALLEEPINYIGYQVIAGGQPAQFTLEHSFSDGRPAGLDHLPGWGSLRLFRSSSDDKSDHRVYVTDVMKPGPLKAAGATVVSLNGLGHMQARLRSFSVLINE